MVAGLTREIDKEFDMEVTIGDPFYVFTYTNPIKGSHSIEVVYFARFTSALGELAINSEDHSKFKWFSEGKLDNVVCPAKGADDSEFQAIRNGLCYYGVGLCNFSPNSFHIAPPSLRTMNDFFGTFFVFAMMKEWKYLKKKI